MEEEDIIIDEIEEEPIVPQITIKLNKQGPQGLRGPAGTPGVSPQIGVYESTSTSYKLSIQTDTASYITPNLKGEKGADGYTLSYTYDQGIASDTWSIEHNLNKYPSVFAVDSSGRVQLPNEIAYVNENEVVLYFLSAFTGKAYLN